MTLHGPTSAAYSAAACIVSADTSGFSVTSRTWSSGMTSVCPSVTGLSGTSAMAYSQERTMVAGASPARMSQNTQEVGSGMVGPFGDAERGSGAQVAGGREGGFGLLGALPVLLQRGALLRAAAAVLPEGGLDQLSGAHGLLPSRGRSGRPIARR